MFPFEVCIFYRKKRDEGKRSRGKKRRQEQHRGREKQGRQGGVRRKELVSYGLLWEAGKAYWSLFHYRKGTVFEL